MLEAHSDAARILPEKKQSATGERHRTTKNLRQLVPRTESSSSKILSETFIEGVSVLNVLATAENDAVEVELDDPADDSLSDPRLGLIDGSASMAGDPGGELRPLALLPNDVERE
jgi:hypothetical protein